MITTEALVAAALGDRDQWVQGHCAQWLTETGDTRPLQVLLGARSAAVRLTALRGLPDVEGDDGLLRALLLDPASRVRDEARRRARQRGGEVAEVYRRELQPDAPARVVVACLEGLAHTGADGDLECIIAGLRHASPRVRAAAVAAVAASTTREDALELLAPVLLDARARVAGAAARELARLNAPPA
ncbi:hypothetical protein, partial [Cellulomonas bogoriensis]|uniref:hypothetical protein n=1 Tax=Cellulomonas bogoriensis TaxID=301388 RepID=UPI0018DC4919